MQLEDESAAVRSPIQAEDQLDRAAKANPDKHPWQQIERALQEAMKALAADNPRYAQIALQEVVGPAQNAVE